MIKSFTAVFAGGGLGASFRYLMILLLSKKIDIACVATFLINILGCFLIGIFLTYLMKKPVCHANSLKLFFVTGIAGGFTTFSSFIYEIYLLLSEGSIVKTVSYISLSLFVGFFAVLAGIFLVQKFV